MHSQKRMITKNVDKSPHEFEISNLASNVIIGVFSQDSVPSLFFRVAIKKKCVTHERAHSRAKANIKYLEL